MRRVKEPHTRAHPAREPAVLTIEHTVLYLVRCAPSEGRAVELVLRACRERLTTPERLRATMAGQPRVRRRRLIAQVCTEVAAGVTSPLERRYRSDVAIAHGLPLGRAQVRASGSGGAVYRDVVIEDHGVVIELDGRVGHDDGAATFRDQWRDNAATLTGLATLRFGWLAIVGNPCGAAGQVAGLLRIRGWRGQPWRCGPACTVGQSFLAA